MEPEISRLNVKNPEEEQIAQSDTDSDYLSPRSSIQLAHINAPQQEEPSFEELVKSSINQIISQQ